MRRSIRWSVALAALPILASCTQTNAPATPGPASPSQDPLRVRVAFLQDLSPEEADTGVAPAFQAASLAFANAALHGGAFEVELVPFDTGGDPDRAAEIAAEIASDDTVVAALGAPYLDGQAALGDALETAGVPWLTLSGRGTALGERGWTAWRRLVADEAEEGTELAGTADELRASRRGVCLLGDGSSASRSLNRAVLASLETGIVLRGTWTPTSVPATPAPAGPGASDIAEVGCGVVLWTGGALDGGALRRELVAAGLRDVRFAGGDAMKRDDYLEAVGPAGEGTGAVCPCVDLSISTTLAARRFIQDYQAEYGVPPGPFAAEAWDAAGMLLDALRSGALTRPDMAAAVGGLSSFEGLAGAYDFTSGGELTPETALVRRYLDEGGRWIEVTVGP